MRLKIAVSVVRFRPWAPLVSKGNPAFPPAEPARIVGSEPEADMRDRHALNGPACRPSLRQRRHPIRGRALRQTSGIGSGADTARTAGCHRIAAEGRKLRRRPALEMF